MYFNFSRKRDRVQDTESYVPEYVHAMGYLSVGIVSAWKEYIEPVAKRIVRLTLYKVPRAIDKDDILSELKVVFVNAYEKKWDFPVLLVRMQGEIIDFVRRESLEVRITRNAESAVKRKAEKSLITDAGGEKTKKRRGPVYDYQVPRFVDIDDVAEDLGDAYTFESEEAFLKEIQKRRELSMAAPVVAKLSDKTRRALHMYYAEGLTLREIGEHLVLSESRVSQLLTEARGLLQAALRPTPSSED